MQRKLYLETYGCQMNESDSELVLGHLRRHGYEQTDEIADADVVLVNTCAIREHAEERILGRLGYYSTFKARKPELVVGVLGCMGQHQKQRLLDTPQGSAVVDLVVGPDGYRRLPQLIDEARGDAPFLEVRLDRDELYTDIDPLRAEGVRAWITIMRGCDKFCTFCIVPFVRGRERCLPAQTVIDQVKQCAGQGYKEVVFLGQTVNSYKDGEVDFGALLRRANDVEGIERIRFTSPHPADMTDSVIEAMAECEKVMPQIHLPLQSASNRVLETMKRTYTFEQYDDLIHKLRESIEGIAISTDIIVGFHGEMEEDFLATYAYMQKTRFDSAFMFKYSRRQGTRACPLGDSVPEEEKGRRLQAIIQLQEGIAAEVNQSWVGRMVDVLIEGESKKSDNQMFGKSPQFKTAVLAKNGYFPGEIVSTSVTRATAHTLFCEA